MRITARVGIQRQNGGRDFWRNTGDDWGLMRIVILSGVGEAAQEVGGDEGFSRAGGQGKQGAGGAAAFGVARQLLHDGANGGVL